MKCALNGRPWLIQNIILINCIQELSYFLFVLTMTLLLPLVLMLGSYVTIIILIYRRSQSQVFGTISSQGVIGRARIQTIKVTGVLVLGFILCWTPYYTMTFW